MTGAIHGWPAVVPKIIPPHTVNNAAGTTLGRRCSGSRIPEFRFVKKVATVSDRGPERTHPITQPIQEEIYTRPTSCGVKLYGLSQIKHTGTYASPKICEIATLKITPHPSASP